jgi:four helix bundle protein
VAITPQRQKPFEIRQRTFIFARDVLKAYPADARRHAPSAEIWRQLVRSSASVGANLEEADAGSSKIDFAYRVKVAVREARESKYWLRLIEGAGLEGKAIVRPLLQESSELVAILTTIAKNAAAAKKKTQA